MRNLFVVPMIGLLAGCATWQAQGTGHARPNAEGRVLVVMRDQALDLDDARADDAEIRGTTVGRWTFPRGEFDNRWLEYLKETNDSPADVAQRLSWQPDRTSRDEPAQIRIGDVVLVRNRDPRTGLTIAAVFASLGAAALALGIAFVLLISSSLSCGRPLRVRGRRVITRATPTTESTGWSEPLALAPVPESARRILAEVWTLEARAEHAAVAAFAKGALELMALGAPPELVVRANRAAIQEVEHARLCFAVASAYTGRTLEPASLPEALAGDKPDLSRFASESLLDGCLREGLAARIAQMGADRARDPQIVRVLRVQSKEEAQHAALSWDIVEWALGRGGEPLRWRLLADVDKLEFPRCDDLPEHGRVGRELVAPEFERIRAEARDRLASAAEFHHHRTHGNGNREEVPRQLGCMEAERARDAV